MKFILLFFVPFWSVNLNAQKYALLDKHLAKPVTYTNSVTSTDKFNDLFPIEKKMLPQFIKALEEIENKLSSKLPFGETIQYEFGCIKFAGITVQHGSQTRMDYVLTSTCDDVIISMHLCDTKISNENNIFFIKTWVNYIHRYLN
jgi:hypothetical protein